MQDSQVNLAPLNGPPTIAHLDPLPSRNGVEDGGLMAFCHESELGSTIVLLHYSRMLYSVYKGAPYAYCEKRMGQVNLLYSNRPARIFVTLLLHLRCARCNI